MCLALCLSGVLRMGADATRSGESFGQRVLTQWPSKTIELCFHSLSLEDLGSPYPSLGQPLTSQGL